MHHNILSQSQTDLLPLISSFNREYYLVGGTAIALYLGHRRSIDFDLFKYGNINHKKNIDKIRAFNMPFAVTRHVSEQLNLTIKDVKVTFFEYPFKINLTARFDKHIRLPSLIDLAAMKSYALGRRSKWKDYVDLFFLIRDFYSVDEIAGRAEEIFGELFSNKLFRAQLSYFEDIDYTEEVDYLVTAPTNDEIKYFLIDKATSII
ncbi:MAG: nucleotidyl transferase AbiEii/AbiGii toxin family protein [Prolixibacteraceae bacterium]|jgi:hypothetical protein|nr:nucleotidyl transferase AbiEii/AbiGii toxin family protein [Prolixibacteraceae bacterium]